VLRYRVTNPAGKRVENVMPIGLAQEFPKDEDARCEADRLGLSVRINDSSLLGRIRFDFLAEHYLRADVGVDAVRPKSVNTISHVEQVVRAYLIPRFGNEIADIKPLDLQRWLKSLHDSNSLAWTDISEMRGVMRRIYKIGIVHEHVARSPVLHVETRSNTDYKPIVIIPSQTLAILNSLPSRLHFTLVLTCAATALRASEMLALRWSDVLWNEGRIRISKRWAKSKDGETKTDASDGYVPLRSILVAHLLSWREQSPHAKDGDFVFPFLRAYGSVPLSASIFVADHLRRAAKRAGVHIQDGQRFGLHNLRHSLSNWLVNKAKVEPKTVQGILRHSKIQTTLDRYTQEDRDERTSGAGGVSDGARRVHLYSAVRCGLDCGLRFLVQHPVTY
jgi:integrase